MSIRSPAIAHRALAEMSAVAGRLALALAGIAALAGCNRSEPPQRNTGQHGAPAPRKTGPHDAPAQEAAPATAPERAGAPSSTSHDQHAAAREAMVREQIEERGVRDPAVLRAMRAVPRHELVPAGMRDQAYDDHPLPIGHEQTISQPYIVALMTELAEVKRGERVLEVGTGSGYQAAVLASLGAEVYSIEIVESLARRAKADLERLGYRVHVRAGDGYRGWPAAAPFDAILVTAAPPRVPQPLVDQLARGGRMVIPVGDNYQELRVLTRDQNGAVRDERVTGVRFVPMTGEAQERR